MSSFQTSHGGAVRASPPGNDYVTFDLFEGAHPHLYRNLAARIDRRTAR
jgi:hypothetical protein